MSDINATFYLPAGLQSGMLTGGFVGGNQLSNPGSLNVTVVYPAAAANAPSSLTGTFVLTASPLGDSNQAAPSPFTISAANQAFKCITSISAPPAPAGDSATNYVFTGIAYPGGLRGNYELTFIVSDGTTQWSIDPEFDTTN